MRSLAARLAALTLLAVVATPVLSVGEAAAEGPPKSVRVFVIPEFDKTYPGGFGEVEAGMENLRADRTLFANIRTTIIYSDGRRDTVMRWRRPLELKPEQGFSAFILFAVPKDTPLGTAEVVTVATVYRLTAAGAPFRLSRHPYVVAKTSFEVVRKSQAEAR